MALKLGRKFIGIDLEKEYLELSIKRFERVFSLIKDKTVSKEFPVQYGVDSNHCLTHSTQKPKNRDNIIKELSENGYEQTAKKYFGCSVVHKIYWLIPPKVRNLIRKMRGN